MDIYLKLILWVISHGLLGCCVNGFFFANSYGSNMVLQRAPMQATVWGHADLTLVGSPVKVTLTSNISGNDELIQEITVVVTPGADGLTGMWQVLLPATPKGGPYTLTATLGSDTIQLENLLFGDVWLCSGQSNMFMQTFKTVNGTEEILGASNYKNIRLFGVNRQQSPVPLHDIASVSLEWTQPADENVAMFSSLCWTYGRKLHEHTHVPIGLVASSFGGTPVEAWSSTDALRQCYSGSSRFGPSTPSVLWNAMIHPLLKMSITGVIWYQGEWNANRMDITAGYECTFPAMIRDWRYKFLTSTQQTDPEFPFGFVQIAGTSKDWNRVDGYPYLRWKQTAERAKVPNEQLPNTFMAVAMDLPDFESPWGPVHPRDKTTIADRLMLGVRAVHLMEKGIEHTGPLPHAYRYKPMTYTLDIMYDKSSQIALRNVTGFEVCCSDSLNTPCSINDLRWVYAPITGSNMTSLTLSTELCDDEHLVGHRYGWKTNPCPYKKCAVYGATSNLPAPVYISNGQIKGDGAWHTIKF